MGTRSISTALWIAAFALTVLLAVFQRMTGPSHPLRGEMTLESGEIVTYRLPRSDEGRGRLRVEVAKPSPQASMELQWRRWPTEDPFESLEMTETEDGRVEASIPKQPAAGKVEYRIQARINGTLSSILPSDSVVARYRGEVPAGVLIPHILAMFASMLISTRALFEVLRPGPKTARGLVIVSMGLLIIGGLFLGPIVQKFAFGAYWTGWPFGHDLTDNKTLIAFLAWLPATIAALRGLKTRLWVVLGWIVMMGVFLIPHSLRGSEYDWSADPTPVVSAREAR